MTVSYALRNHPKISEKTRVRIQEVAERLGYRPDPEISKLMRHLRDTRRTAFSHSLAFVNSWPDKEEYQKGYVGGIYKGAKARAEALGFHLEPFWLGDYRESEEKLSAVLHHRGVPGLLLPPWHKPDLAPAFVWEHFAAVTTTLSIHEPKLNRVANHFHHNMELALRILTERGYKRIGFVETADFHLREESMASGAYHYYAAAQSPRRRIPTMVFTPGDTTSLFDWFDRHKPDAFIGSLKRPHDLLAERGVRFPEDCGFLCLDALQHPALAAVDARPEDLGHAAIDNLVAQIFRNESGLPALPKLTLIEGRFRDGCSIRS
ncbi:MAG: LacI family DNA-binding transcriptional regulator [Verrucomicrobia bacterium]|nr:LacI family DNA-binding transcriptional regulator [Verrucomicrobiota bacterium]